MTHDVESGGVGRRGALAALLGTAAVATAGTAATAAPQSNVQDVAPSGSPVTRTIASPALRSYSYRTLMYLDFLPLDPANQARNFNGGGVYSATTLQASVEIPAGALLRNVEWYVENSSANPAVFYCALWTPATGYITPFVQTAVPGGAASPTATQTLTTEANWGPYPDGSKLVLYGSTSSSVLLNGVRLGFSGGGLETGLKTGPEKVYDSSVTGGKFANNESRTIQLTNLIAGTTAAVLRVSVSSPAGAGLLKIYASGQTEPEVGSLSYPASISTAGETIARLGPDRKIVLKASRSTHVRIDVVGQLR